MALTVDEINVVLGADVSGFVSGINQADNNIGRLRRSLDSAVGPSQAVAKVVGAAGVALIGFGAASVKMAADMEQTRIGFTTLLGSGQKAEEFLKGLADFAAKTPFELTGLQKSSKQLLAFGFSAEEIIPIMTNVGDAVSALGGGEEEISRVVRALGQMQAKGKVSAEEMNQLAELGVPVWELLAKSIGVSVPEAMAMASKGAIDASTGINGVLAGMAGKFGGSMEAQSKTLTGMFSNVKDNIGQLMISLGNEIITALNLKAVLQNIMDLTGRFRELVKETGSITGALEKLIPPDTQAMIIAVAGGILGALVPAFIALGGAIITATIPLLPYIAAGALLAAIGLKIYKNWGNITGTFDSVTSSIKNAWKNTKTFVGNLTDDVVGFFKKWGPTILAVLVPFIGIPLLIIKNWDKIEPALKGSWNKVISGTKTAIASLKAGWNDFINFIGTIPEKFSSFMSRLPYLAGFYLGTVVKYFLELPGKIGAALASLASTASTAWSNMLTNASMMANRIVTSVVNYFSQLPGRIYTWLTQAYTNLTTSFSNMASSAANGASNVLTNASNYISQVPGRVWSYLSTAASNAGSAMSTLVSNVSSYLSQVPGKVSSYLSTAASNAYNGAYNVVANIRNFIQGVPGIFTDSFGKMLNYISGLPGILYNKAYRIASDFWAGFKAALYDSPKTKMEYAFINMGTQAKNTLSLLSGLSPQFQSRMKRLSNVILPKTGLMTAGAAAGAVPITPTTYPTMGTMSATSAMSTRAALKETKPTEASYTPVIVNQMNVRKDSDIEAVSRQLFKLQQNQLRARGITP